MACIIKCEALISPAERRAVANLSDFVVVCQEHGQILRLLDG